MQKYWKSLVVLVVIVASLGTYYVKAYTIETYPEFTLTTVSGDDEAAEGVQLDMYYSKQMGTRRGMMDGGQNITVTSEGTTDPLDVSYFAVLDGVAGPAQYARLVEDHRQFMRGKQRGMGNFYEDNDNVAYANVNYDFQALEAQNYRFELAVLDKQDDNVTEFTYDIESEDKVNHMNVRDVQKVDDTLKVFAKVFSRSNEQNNTADRNTADIIRKQQVKVFTFDLDSHNLVNQKMLGEIGGTAGESSETKGDETTFQMVEGSPTSSSNDYVVFRKETLAYRNNQDSMQEPQPVGLALIAYDLNNDQAEKIELPDRLADKSRAELFDGKRLYFTETNDKGVTIIAYSIEDQTIVNETQLEMDNAQKMQSRLNVSDDRMYITVQDNNRDTEALPRLFIVNRDTNETVYEGEIKAESPSDLPENFRLDINDVKMETSEE